MVIYFVNKQMFILLQMGFYYLQDTVLHVG